MKVVIGAFALWSACLASPPQTNCGVRPGDWCPAPPGDPCGAHRDEKSCRADAACRGLPYRGESVVACQPDGHGFWSNCPAVGCVSRSDPPGKPPRADVVSRLCGDSRLGGAGAEIHVWRTAQDAATVLELRAGSASAHRTAVYYDSAGRQLLSMPSAIPRDSDLGRNLDRQRVSILKDLREAETVSCQASAP
jgi:hypothetical protein